MADQATRRTIVGLLSVGFMASCVAEQELPSDLETLDITSSALSAPAAEPRMKSAVYHPSIHLDTNYTAAASVTARAKKVKELVLGSSAAATCYQGPSGKAQLAVETEFIAPEFADAATMTSALSILDSRLDALFAEGLAVHLLLPVHQVKELPYLWKGVDWVGKATWANSSAFVPMKPCPDEYVGSVKCPYDVLFDDFHTPVIQHLVATGRASKLAVIYVMNEFGYDPNQKSYTSADWGGVSNWRLKRAEALAYTAKRALDNARAAAGGQVPVGIKFASVIDSNTGWAKDTTYNTDQLSYILNNVMAPNGDVLGYDIYFDGTGYDSDNRTRFAPFLPSFASGRFELSEFGRKCEGLPGQFTSGSRTTSADITGAASTWSYEKGLNLFSFKTDLTDAKAGCYALTDPNNMNYVYPNAQAEALGLWELIKAATGTTSPTQCGTCSPVVTSVSPITATLNQQKSFTVSGSCLPGTLVAWIADCANLAVTSVSSTSATFTCKPSYSTGLKAGIIKDMTGGTTLKNFTVTVQ